MKITRNQLRRLIKEEITRVLEAEDPFDTFDSGPSPRRTVLKPIEKKTSTAIMNFPKRSGDGKDGALFKIKAGIIHKLTSGWKQAKANGELSSGGKKLVYIIKLKSYPSKVNEGTFNIVIAGKKLDKSSSNVTEKDSKAILKYANIRGVVARHVEESLDGEYWASIATPA